jgi:hypothetical protein
MLKKWCGRYMNALTLCVHAGLLVAFLLRFETADKDVIQLFLLISLACSLVAWRFNLQRLLAIAEHPTSTIAAAAQGYVELAGRARQLLPLTSPLSGIACVWFRYWVYVKDHNNIWRLEDYKSSEQKFEIEDTTGRCLVDPTHAEIVMAERHGKTQNDHRYIEQLLRAGKRLYVLGELETITEVSAARQLKQQVNVLLTQWKKAPEQLRRRFDFNGDGEIDTEEWEHARAAASHEVHVSHGLADQQERHKIRAPADHRLFLISAISPQQLRGRYKFWVVLHLGAAATASALALLAAYGHTAWGLW